MLQFFLNESELVPFKLPVKNLSQGGITVPRAERGAFVTVASDKTPAVGQEISKVYARDLELPGVRHRDFPPYTIVLPVRITVTSGPPDSLRIETINGELPPFTHPCSRDKKEPHPGGITRVKKALAQAEIPFLRLEVKEIIFEGSTPPPEQTIGNRQLRKIRDAFVLHVAQVETARKRKRYSAIHTANRRVPATPAYSASDGIRSYIHNRANLNPPVPPHGLIPFYLGGQLKEDTLARTGNMVFIPLKPVVSDKETEYYRGIEQFLQTNPGVNIFLGINNLHHLPFVRAWERFSHVFSFIDFFFYLANTSAGRFILEQLKKVAFGYYWIEGEEKDRISLESEIGFPLFGTGTSFKAPYFYHEGDFSRESLRLNMENPEEIPVTRLRYGTDTFQAVTKDGETYIFPLIQA